MALPSKAVDFNRKLQKTLCKSESDSTNLPRNYEIQQTKSCDYSMFSGEIFKNWLKIPCFLTFWPTVNIDFGIVFH